MRSNSFPPVSLRVELVNSLVDEQLGAGRHEVVWNGRNDAGALVSSGVYLYRFEVDDVVQMKRMMLLK